MSPSTEAGSGRKSGCCSKAGRFAPSRGYLAEKDSPHSTDLPGDGRQSLWPRRSLGEDLHQGRASNRLAQSILLDFDVNQKGSEIGTLVTSSPGFITATAG